MPAITDSFRNPLEFLLDHAEETPAAPALLADDRALTYAELRDAAVRRAGWFRQHGLRSGMRAALYTNNDLELTISLFAIWISGAVCVPMNITQKPDKLHTIETIITPDLGFYTDDIALDAHRPFPTAPLVGDAAFGEPIFAPAPDDCSIIMFTSGTSGVPKAVPMTYGALGHNAWETSARLGIVSVDRVFVNSPPYYTSAIVHGLTLFARGGSVYVNRGFLMGADLLEIIRDNRCTGFGGVPVHFTRLAGALNNATEPPTCLRFLMNSGEHLPTPVLKKIYQAFPGIQFFCVYGLTEVAGRLCILSPDRLDSKIGSVGLPLPGMEITIRDEAGREMRNGEAGEVYVQGVCLMKGYLNNPKANEKSMKPYGFATGDFGYKDAEGYLYLLGRHDDIIKVGGEKVSVKMIEDAIHGFEAFTDFFVYPLFDEHMGTVPCVNYVLKQGAAFHKKELLKHLRQRLPANHIPAYFKEVTEIPRSSSGKVLRPAAPGTGF
jgi:long-chain acyl-CoA synthetase